jgi:integrase/recombinase XerC
VANDSGTTSLDVKKNRVWALHLFYHFLKINNLITDNPASFIPYPRIGRTVPKYLTSQELNRLLDHLARQAHTLVGLRNLIIIMLLGFLGLRISAVVKLNIEDLDLKSSLIWICEKGRIKRSLCLPQALCAALQAYLTRRDQKEEPLLVSKQNERISQRTIQDLLKKAMDELQIDKHLHAHLFRHTAATHLNKVAGPDITRHVLGHADASNTERYTHLNPDIYATYMQKHPYMSYEWR